MTKPPERLDHITTLASVLRDPSRFLLRYHKAIRRYMGAVVQNPTVADDLTHDLLTKFLMKGNIDPDRSRGRFRDYLRTAARNVARTHFRDQKHAPQQCDSRQVELLSTEDAEHPADQQWAADWRAVLLDACWHRLEHHQYQHPGCLYHTVLKLVCEFPEDTSEQLAARLSVKTSQPMRADAFRKQLSRARHAFAEYLIREVSLTLEHPDPERIDEELADLGLLSWVKDYRGS